MSGIVNSTGAKSGIIGTTVGTPSAGGITHASQWRIVSEFSGSADPIASATFEAVDTDGFGVLGAVMTTSSGVWTFPATGIWKIEVHLGFYNNAATSNTQVQIYTTLNNGGAWAVAALGLGFIEVSPSTYTYTACDASFIFDVTNVSNDKCKFATTVVGTAPYFMGSSDTSYCQFNFIRLGDT